MGFPEDKYTDYAFKRSEALFVPDKSCIECNKAS